MSFQFKISLRDVKGPPVWRRLLVPEEFTFYRFHLVIQEAFGWRNTHLFHFSQKGWRSKSMIGLKTEEDDDVEDCAIIKLSQVFHTPRQTYTYTYDFGDDWLHSILLEKNVDETLTKAQLIVGKGRCPPEDCGGFSGYEHLKKVLADPSHPEYNTLKKWLQLDPGQEWNPNTFDLEKMQASVRQM